MKKMLLLVLLVCMLSSYTQAQVRRDTAADSSFRAFLAEWEKAQSRFINGDPTLWKQNSSHREDATILGGFGGYGEKGWDAVGARYDWASSQYKSGGATMKVEYLTIGVSGDLGFTVSMKTKFIVPLILLLSFQSVLAQDRPSIADVDRIRLAEAFKLGEASRMWKDWDKAPFAVLFVTPEYEFLIRHPKPSQDFTRLGFDSMLKSDVYFRKRTQRTVSLATFPAIKGSIISTIVVGQAENTSAKTSTPWIVTVLHEHFHQLQNSQLTYYADVNALNLSRGDQSGMWMLDYAFPYDKKEIQEQFAVLSRLLVKALDARRKLDRSEKLAAYLQARQRFQQMLSPDDYRYFSFQIWQEGIARYTEYHIAKLAATKYKPSKEFRALKDFTSFEQVANSIRERIFKQLLTQQLGESKRIAFYSFGAAEGLLLDKVNPAWRSQYFVSKFDLSKYYEAAR